MKIGLLTFHYCCNPGAVLQAYALQTYLKSHGQEAIFINYKLDVLTKRYDPFLPLKNILQGKNSILGLKTLVCGLLFSISRYFKFRKFRKNFLTESKSDSCYNYPIIIIGSDQIWNKNITHGLNNNYWGHFEKDKDCKLYSYAGSAGEIDTKDEKHVSESLSMFSGISVREISLYERLKGMGINSTVVLDPVFLINAENWSQLVLKKPNRHVCLYNILGVPLAKSLAEKISNLSGLRISSCIRNKNGTALSPQEFLNSVYNSEFVITSSFHGLAFALIFNKNFWVPNIEGPKGERMRSLLSLVGLEDRIVSEDTGIDFEKLINWEEVNKKLEKEIYQSKRFIRDIVNNV